VFFYSEPILETETIIYDTLKILNNKSQSSIVIVFGGRLSTIKTSKFTIDFSDFDNKALKDLIIDHEENKLSIDTDNEKGIDRKSVVDYTMNYEFGK
jgi:hypothetical protein